MKKKSKKLKTIKKLKSKKSEINHKNNPFHNELLLSPELKIIFSNKYEKLSRPNVVKYLWQYIHKNQYNNC